MGRIRAWCWGGSKVTELKLAKRTLLTPMILADNEEWVFYEDELLLERKTLQEKLNELVAKLNWCVCRDEDGGTNDGSCLNCLMQKNDCDCDICSLQKELRVLSKELDERGETKT